MRKYDSVIRLRTLGFNILPLLLYSGSTTEGDVSRILGAPPWAIRSERGEEAHCPFIRGWYSPYNLLREAESLEGEGYALLLCGQPSEANRARANGSVLIPPRDHSAYLPRVEYGIAETQRDLKDVSLRSLDLWTKIPRGSLEDELVTRVLVEAMSRVLFPCILEWTLFTEPLGELNRTVVWWEQRQWT